MPELPAWHHAEAGPWRAEVPVPEETLRWVERSLAARLGSGVRVVSCTPLYESSTSKHRVEVSDGPRASRTVLLRRYVDRARLGADPWYEPANEAEVLRRLGPTAIPAPRLLAFDPDGPVGAPALVTELLPGHPPTLDEDAGLLVEQLGERLAQLHALPASLGDGLPPYEPYERRDTLAVPAWSERPEIWRAVIDELAHEPAIAEPRLIHRDPHPGNVLWDGETITGIVDWATGCAGPAAIDLARPRLNLARDLGPPWPDRLLEAYRRAAGGVPDDQRWWDLRDAAEFIGVDVDEEPETPMDAERWDRFEGWVGSVLDQP